MKELNRFSRLFHVMLRNKSVLFMLPEEVVSTLERSVENHEKKLQASETGVGYFDGYGKYSY